MSSEKHEDRRLNDDVLVRLEREVDGLLDSGSGLDSQLLRAESIDQLGYLEGESDGAEPGAGVFGGEKVRPRT